MDEAAQMAMGGSLADEAARTTASVAPARVEEAGEQEARGRTEKVCRREGTRGKVRGGFEWASRGSKPGSGGGRSSANQRRHAAVEAL